VGSLKNRSQDFERLQDFYNRGYRDGVSESLSYIDSAIERFNHTPIKNDVVVGDLFRTLKAIMEQQMIGKHAKKDQEPDADAEMHESA
jgi:hypothetical protein